MTREKFIDPKNYNFIIGLAVSSDIFTDGAKRALWDNLKRGRVNSRNPTTVCIAARQKLYVT